MSDIVKQLLSRSSDEAGIGWTPTTVVHVPASLLHDAADTITALRAEVEKAREILAETAVGSLPHDYPLERLATETWNTLQARTLEGLALIGKVETLTARVEELEGALKEIIHLTERPADLFPSDWKEQIAACPDCQRYKDHPIQRGICDTHRRPIYATEAHSAHETRILGYRAKDIARAAITKGERNG
jgi:hypothetical protein